jgi:hypothetical protein
LESFKCEILPSETLIIKTTTSKKRIGTNSVYDLASLSKRDDKSTTREESDENDTEGEEEEEASTHISQNEEDATSSEDEIKKKQALSIEGMFKYLKMDKNAYIYQCKVDSCKQVNTFIFRSSILRKVKIEKLFHPTKIFFD